MKIAYLLLLGATLTLATPAAEGPPPAPDKMAPPGGVARLPVKEVTVFKDGHAFVVHEGKHPVGAEGEVVMDYTVSYEDVFVLDLPFAPPPELAHNLNSQPQADLARLFGAPKVMHKARLANQSNYPFTTAPALVLRAERLIAQGLMTYTAIGASTDLRLTTAVDIQVKKTDSETKRTPNAFQQNGDNYMRVDLNGSIRLTNRRGQPVRVEVNRHVLGHVDAADHDGKTEMSNVFESRDHLPIGDYDGGSYWWNWFNWPWWWHHVNGLGRITWNAPLEPGQTVELGYAWHYYWR